MSMYGIFLLILLLSCVRSIPIKDAENTVLSRLEKLEEKLKNHEEDMARLHYLESWFKELHHKLSDFTFEKRQISSKPGSTQVAFSTYLSGAIHNLQIGQLIGFDSVAVNIGDGFDASTGTFTCPVSGIYFFTVTLMSYLDNELKAELVLDGNNIAGVYTAGGSSSIDNQGSNSVVTRCEAGQKLLVRAFDISGSKIWGHPTYRWSTFSGFLLYPLETEIIG